MHDILFVFGKFRNLFTLKIGHLLRYLFYHIGVLTHVRTTLYQNVSVNGEICFFIWLVHIVWQITHDSTAEFHVSLNIIDLDKE